MAIPARTLLVSLAAGDFVELQVFQAPVPQSTRGGDSVGGSVTVEWVRQI